TPAGLHRLHIDEVTGLAVTGDSAEAGSVASVSEDGHIVYWNHHTGVPPLPPARVDEQTAVAVAWDPANPAHGVTGGAAGGALLLDYGAEQRRPLARPQPGWADAVAVAISPDADRLAVARSTVEPVGTDGDRRPKSEVVLTDSTDPDPHGPAVPI